MKKILSLFTAFIYTTFFSINITLAKEDYYQNTNGVIFTEEEYSFISKFYFEGYQDYMTKDEYDIFINSNIMNGEINIISSSDYVPYTEIVYPTNMKILKMASSCDKSRCKITVILDWKEMPKTRSYDTIGLYLTSASIKEKGSSKMYVDSNSYLPVMKKETSNGISSTYKLPSSGNTLKFVKELTVSKSGRVTASYQHATTNITLEDSQNFNFSPNGMGGVFAFNYPVNTYYDGMLGVYLDL